MRRVFVLAATVWLTTCAATGVRVDADKVSALKIGQTSFADAVAALGPPTSQMHLGNGTMIVSYSYVQVSARPESFIPIIGPFVGGADSRASSVTLRFAPDGRLADVISSESQYGTGTGVFSGARSVAPTNQPAAPE